MNGWVILCRHEWHPSLALSDMQLCGLPIWVKGLPARIFGIFENCFRERSLVRAGDFSVVGGPFFTPQKNQKNRENRRLIGVPQGVGGGRGGRYTAGRPRFDLDT
jgi:hypothetical protein